ARSPAEDVLTAEQGREGVERLLGDLDLEARAAADDAVLPLALEAEVHRDLAGMVSQDGADPLEEAVARVFDREDDAVHAPREDLVDGLDHRHAHRGLLALEVDHSGEETD